ncbi:helix-turn-helix transcriptional regulator [Haloarcula onubensis]|uniref:ArsR family transcriptional regulator n=1 Tax=Haloarcula onubensis TaxID=2950539 RepID=A0ABU2FL11_9EURY|nr:hypothetical protein [Halomicroarcula sp. S3CR25-11]MDS0281427.1 hypothetical protein [Halomicroarcula sp. S3CR25-11]
MVTVPNDADVVAKRRDVLAALSTPKTKPALVEALDASRSTVDRAVDALQEHDFVTRRGSEYVATYAGRAAVDAYGQYLDRLDALAAAQPVVAELPPDVDIPPAVLDGATVTESVPEAPEAPVETNVPIVTDARRFRGTGPVVLPRYIDVTASLVESGTETELVLTEAVVDVLAETYPEGLSTFEANDGISLYVTDEQMPYAVWTAETPEGTVSGIVVYSESGIVGNINNDTTAMNEWAASQYDRIRREARPLD